MTFKITHMYPAVFKCRSLLSQSQDEQAHVILFPSSQTKAEAPLAALQLHHKTALVVHRQWAFEQWSTSWQTCDKGSRLESNLENCCYMVDVYFITKKERNTWLTVTMALSNCNCGLTCLGPDMMSVPISLGGRESPFLLQKRQQIHFSGICIL